MQFWAHAMESMGSCIEYQKNIACHKELGHQGTPPGLPNVRGVTQKLICWAQSTQHATLLNNVSIAEGLEGSLGG